jgi:glycosyltransferase involved in cell wall biosynthesis
MEFLTNIFEHYSWQGIALVFLAVTLFAIQIYYYAVVYNRIISFRLMREREKRRENPAISIIVPMRGESERFLVDELPALLHQEYDHYEVVVVYIGSDNDYYDELQRIRDNHSYMRLTRMGGSNERFYISTKQALNVGIKSAQYDCLLFTIPGATPVSNEWVATMAKGFERGSVVIAPAVPNFEGNNLSTYIMRMIELNQMRNAMVCAIEGRPYYAPRSNYGFDRKLYDSERGYNYLGLDIGENDLFLQEIATAKRTSVVMSRHSIVKEERIDMVSEWKEQMRYYGNTRQFYPAAAKHFTTRELGSRALFFIVAIAIIVILPLELKLGAIGLLLVRYAIAVWSSRRVAHKLGERDMALKYWIYDLLGPMLEWMLWSKKSRNLPNTSRIWK